MMSDIHYIIGYFNSFLLTMGMPQGSLAEVGSQLLLLVVIAWPLSLQPTHDSLQRTTGSPVDKPISFI